METLGLVAAQYELRHVNDVGLRAAEDQVLMDFCGQKRLVLVTEDKKMLRNPLRSHAFVEAGIGLVLVRFSKNNSKFDYKDKVYERYAHSFCELVRHPTPFVVSMNNSGFWFKRVPERLSD